MKTTLLVLLLVLARAASADDFAALTAFLETNGLVADRDRAYAGAAEGLLKAIDPEARLIAATNDAAAGAARAITPTSGVDTVELWPEKLAYLKLRALQDGTGEEALAHLRPLSGGYGIIVDLRGAAGTDLASVAALAGLFCCSSQTLFSVQDMTGHVVTNYAAQAETPLKASVMVLIDAGTRQAAETLAAVWRGCSGVMLLGSATTGDNRLRDWLTLPDGRRLYIATRQVVPAVGRAYAGTGIRPDIDVAPGGGDDLRFRDTHPRMGKKLSEKSKQDRELMARVDADPALRRATDILLGLRALSIYGQR